MVGTNMMRFLIKPEQLNIDNTILINEKALAIILKNKVQLILDIYDSDEGNTDKSIIVFIHGNSTSKKVFKDQIEYFSKDYRVIAFDLLGHGESSKICDIDISEKDKDILAENFYNPLAMIAQVKQLLKYKNINKAHFVGWSLGGHIAYGIGVDTPELIKSITTIASPPVEFSTEGFKKGFYEFFTNDLIPQWINSPTREIENVEATAEYNGYSDINGKDQFFIEDLKISDPKMRKFLFLGMDQSKNKILDGEKFVKMTKLPICLMIGEYDSGTRVEYILKFRSTLGNKILRNTILQVHVIKDAKHAVFRTNNNEFINILSHFIKTVNTMKNKKLPGTSSWKKTAVKFGITAAATAGLLFMSYKIFKGNSLTKDTVSSNKLML